ncbi:MAG: GIY-YIG nuclease family protein [bacterium]
MGGSLLTYLMRDKPPHLLFYYHKLYNSLMFYVYFLKSLKDDKLYFGSTNDLRRRLSEHNLGKIRSTKGRVPLELKYYEAYFKEKDARERESSLKKDGRALFQLKKRISESLQ